MCVYVERVLWQNNVYPNSLQCAGTDLLDKVEKKKIRKEDAERRNCKGKRAQENQVCLVCIQVHTALHVLLTPLYLTVYDSYFIGLVSWT